MTAKISFLNTESQALKVPGFQLTNETNELLKAISQRDCILHTN